MTYRGAKLHVQGQILGERVSQSPHMAARPDRLFSAPDAAPPTPPPPRVNLDTTVGAPGFPFAGFAASGASTSAPPALPARE